MPVIVHDNHGHLAMDLGSKDFQIYDDGHLEHIDHFSLSSEPLSVVLVVENSPRIAPFLPGIRQSGIIFTDYATGAKGRGAVLAFNDKSDLLVSFTGNADRVQKAISDLNPAGTGAHLYGALGRAVQMLEGQPAGRQRVIIVVAESVDTANMDKRTGILRNAGSVVTGSLGNLTSVLQDAELANISIYSVALPSAAAEGGTSRAQSIKGEVNLSPVLVPLLRLGLHLLRPEALAVASATTGGERISASDGNAIQDAIERIGSDLHAEYMLSYQAPPNGPWTYHRITVKVDRRGYRVLARPGYLLAPPGGATTSGH